MLMTGQQTVITPNMMELARREQAMQFHTDQLAAFNDITALIEQVRRASRVEDYRNIQQQLAAHIERVDASAGEANRRLKNAERKLTRLERGQLHLNPTDEKDLREDQEKAIVERELHLRLGWQYRTVGDALAWQLYGFQALAVYALGMNQSPGPLGTKTGAAGEAQVVEDLWRDEGAFALRHDFTNCLRIWDLSIFYPDDREVEIAEIKSGTGRVGRRQKQQAEIATRLVHHKVVVSDKGRLLVHKAQGPQPTNQTNLPILFAALDGANEQGIGSATNSYLAVIVVDMLNQAVTQPDGEMQARLRQLEGIPAEIQEPLCADYVTAHSGQRMRHAGYSAPYTIYPVPPDFAAALVTGFLRVHYKLNTAAVTQAFRGAGFDAECLLASRRNLPLGSGTTTDYFRVRRGSVSILVGSFLVEQMLFEGLTLDDLVASVAEHAAAIERNEHIVLPETPARGQQRVDALSTFVGLENVWRASRNSLLVTDDEDDAGAQAS